MKNTLISIVILLFCALPVLGQPEIVWSRVQDSVATAAAISPDDKYIAVGFDEGSLKLWDLMTGQDVHIFDRTCYIHSIDFYPDSSKKLIAVAQEDSAIRIWNYKTMELEKSLLFDNPLDYHYSSVSEVKFSPDGKYLYAVMYGRYPNYKGKNSLFIWDTETWQIIRQENIDYLNKVAISPDGKYLLTLENDGRKAVILWYADTFEWAKIMYENDYTPMGVWFTPDSKHFFYSTSNGELNFIDIEKVSKEDIAVGELNQYIHLLFTEDQKIMIASNYYQLRTEIWDLSKRLVLNDNIDIGYEYAGLTSDEEYCFVSSIHNHHLIKLNLNTLSVNDYVMDEVLYPNPTSGLVNIDVDCSNPDSYCEVYNLTGENIFSKSTSNTNTLQLDFSSYPTGTYMIYYHCGENISNYKLLKE